MKTEFDQTTDTLREKTLEAARRHKASWVALGQSPPLKFLRIGTAPALCNAGAVSFYDLQGKALQKVGPPHV